MKAKKMVQLGGYEAEELLAMSQPSFVGFNLTVILILAPYYIRRWYINARKKSALSISQYKYELTCDVVIFASHIRPLLTYLLA